LFVNNLIGSFILSNDLSRFINNNDNHKK